MQNSFVTKCDTPLGKGVFFLFCAIFSTLIWVKLGIPVAVFKLTVADGLLVLLLGYLLLFRLLYISKDYMPFLTVQAFFVFLSGISIFEAKNKFSGFLTLLPFIYALLLTVVTFHIFSRATERHFIILRNLFCAVILASDIPVYLEILGGMTFPSLHPDGWRYAFVTLNPNQYATYAYMALFVIMQITEKYKKNQLFLMFLLSAFTILPVMNSGSKTGLGTILASTFLLFYLVIKKVSYASKVIIASTVFILISQIIFFLDDILALSPFIERSFELFDLVGSGAKTSDLSDTGHSMIVGIQIFLLHPLFGIGLGNFIFYNEFEVHNTFIGALAETGIIGFCSLMSVFAIIIFHIFKSQTNGLKFKLLQLSQLIIFFATCYGHQPIRERWTWIFFAFIFTLSKK